MNSNNCMNDKRIEITPSRRKGIRDDCDVCSSKGLREMGKYGLNDKTQQRVTNLPRHRNTSQEGIDEVDNVMSKHINPSSPKAKPNRARKNSIDSINNTYSEESDDDNTTQEYDSLDPTSSFNSDRGRNNRSNISNSKNFSPHTIRNRRLAESPKPSQKEYFDNNNDGTQWKQYFIFSAVALLCAFIYYYNNEICKNLFSDNMNMMSIYDEKKFYNDLIHFGEKYKVTDDSLLQIQSGISTVFRRQDTGCFIFTYNSGNTKFNTAHFDNFMNDISSAAARYLRNESDIRDHVIVDSSKLDMRVHSELIERYREDVTKTGLMFVKDIDGIPPQLAMAFHYYCDEFNPLIKRSAIFFTLDMAKCSDQKTSHTNIEKCLNNKWTAVSKVNILPLLSRVVSIIVDVTSVF